MVPVLDGLPVRKRHGSFNKGSRTVSQFSIAKHCQIVVCSLSTMSLTHITSQSIRRLLTLTEKKEQLIKGVEEVETEIAKALKGAVTSIVEVAEAVTSFKPAKTAKGKKARKAKTAKKPAKSKKRKSGLTPAGRAKLAANMRARWVARKAGKKA